MGYWQPGLEEQLKKILMSEYGSVILIKGKWTKPVEVANGIQHKDKRYPCWNPVLYNTGKEILLFYKVGPSPSTWWGEIIIIDDKGKTWSRPYRLPEDIYGPDKE